jgi:hypothetical protein
MMGVLRKRVLFRASAVAGLAVAVALPLARSADAVPGAVRDTGAAAAPLPGPA